MAKIVDISDLEMLAGNKILFPVQLDGVKTLEWIAENITLIHEAIEQNGAVVLRGLKRMTSKQFADVIEAVFSEPLLEYTYRSSPRTNLRGKVYTASEYHADMSIVQHNECSYANQWATRLGFYCQQPATKGGQTPIADSLRVYEKIPVDIRAEFEAKKIRYIRNYGLVDLPWQEVFQTEDKLEVQAYCQNNGLTYTWMEGGLRTTQINPAVAVHPKMAAKLWFNQAHLFHLSALPEQVQKDLLAVHGMENLPRHCTFGDGTDIPDEMLNIIRDVYKQEMVSFDWQQNDVLLLDNMRFSHGRTPFEGGRKVLVGMVGKSDWHQCALDVQG